MWSDRPTSPMANFMYFFAHDLKRKISQNFVAFSEYMNFDGLCELWTNNFVFSRRISSTFAWILLGVWLIYPKRNLSIEIWQPEIACLMETKWSKYQILAWPVTLIMFIIWWVKLYNQYSNTGCRVLKCV